MGPSIKSPKEIIQHNMVKKPKWQEADQLAIYNQGRGVELEATEKKPQLAVRAGLEPGTSGFQVLLGHPTSISSMRLFLCLFVLPCCGFYLPINFHGIAESLHGHL